MTTTTRPRSTAATPHHRRRRSAAVAAATLVPLLVWCAAVPVLGVDLAVRPGADADPPRLVGPAVVIVVSLLAGLLGWLLLTVLERRIQRARTVWVSTAGVVLLLSLTGPLTSGASTSAAATLVAMHAGLAAALIPLLVATAGPRHV